MFLGVVIAGRFVDVCFNQPRQAADGITQVVPVRQALEMGNQQRANSGTVNQNQLQVQAHNQQPWTEDRKWKAALRCC